MSPHTESRIEYVVRKLREAMPKNWPEISAQSGVPKKTIHKIAYRSTKDPRSSTLDALHSYFEELECGHPLRRRTDKQSIAVEHSAAIPGTPIDGSKVREAKGGTRKVRTDTRKLRQ